MTSTISIDDCSACRRSFNRFRFVSMLIIAFGLSAAVQARIFRGNVEDQTGEAIEECIQGLPDNIPMDEYRDLILECTEERPRNKKKKEPQKRPVFRDNLA